MLEVTRKLGEALNAILGDDDTPATWAANGRVAAAAVALGRPSGRALEWRTMNDTVMGGRSSSALSLAPGGGFRFAGRISLDGGGFASCRTAIDAGGGGGETLGLAGARAIRLRVTGDGQRYKLALRAGDGYRQPVWQAEFDTAAGGAPTTVELPLDAKTWVGPTIWGRTYAMKRGQAIDWGSFRGISLMLSFLDVHGNRARAGAFHDGPFSLTLHSMELVLPG